MGGISQPSGLPAGTTTAAIPDSTDKRYVTDAELANVAGLGSASQHATGDFDAAGAAAAAQAAAIAASDTAGAAAAAQAAAIAACLTPTGVQTVTNKTIQPRVSTLSNVTSIDVNTDNYDIVSDAGITGAITVNNPTGTPFAGQVLFYKITGTASRAIAWGTNFVASTVALPTTTSGTAELVITFMWSVSQTKWVCEGVA